MTAAPTLPVPETADDGLTMEAHRLVCVDPAACWICADDAAPAEREVRE